MRKARAIKRPKLPDPVYQSVLVTQLINQIMQKGKKNLARKIIYDVLELLNSDKRKAFETLNTAIENIKPKVELKTRKIGGARYRVPVQVNDERQITLALRWLTESIKERKEKTLIEKLSNEIKAASQKTGSTIKKKETIQKMAEANKAFAYYSW